VRWAELRVSLQPAGATCPTTLQATKTHNASTKLASPIAGLGPNHASVPPQWEWSGLVSPAATV